MLSRRLVRNIVRSCIVLGALALFSSAWAMAEGLPRELPPQPLADALDSFAKYTGLQVVYRAELAGGLQSKGAAAGLKAEQALRALLRDTGLTFHFVNDRTVTVMPMASARAPQESPTDGDAGARDERKETRNRGFWDRFRLAQVDQATDSESSTVETSPSNTRGSSNAPVDLEEVVVTGTHIRSHEPIGARVIVITRQEIDESGFGRLQDVLESLPQNFGGTSEASQNQAIQNPSLNRNQGSEIQLRGLGIGTTLTLVNGLRQPAGGLRGAFVDISSIPTAAIERVEILTDGASAIYGSDAIGGVVNVILRKDYAGAESRLRMATANGGAEETTVSQLLGANWSAGNVLLGYQYFRRTDLPASERAYTASNDLRPFGGSDFRLANSNPGTIFASNGQPAFAIPANQDGTNLTTTDLIAGAANYQDTSGNAFLPSQEMNSAFASASHTVADWLDVQAAARFSTREMEAVNTGGAQRVSVPASNAFYFNPFGGTSPLSVGYDFGDDIGPQVEHGVTDTYTGSLQGTAKLGSQWRLVVTGSYGREDNRYLATGLVDPTGLAAALADSNPATALNVFGDGSNTNPATLQALRRTQSSRSLTETWSAIATVDGSVIDLPAGPVRVAIGSAFTDERLSVALETFSTDATTLGPVPNGRRITALFSEIAVPLVDNANGRPGLRQLNLSLAARYEDYSDFGDTFNPKVGMTWAPLESLKVQGTWSTSFRAPPFFQSSEGFEAIGYQVRTVTDPRSPTRSSQVLYTFGNNPNLQPETATVWTTGLVFNPASLPALSASISYYDIDYKDKIATGPSVRSILTVEDQWAPVITRDPTPAQVAEFCSHPISLGSCSGQPFAAIIDGRQRNLAKLRTRGIDGDLRYSVETSYGRLGFGVGGAYVLGYDQQVTSTSSATDLVDTVGNPLSLRLRSKLSWSRGGWHASATIQHSDDYRFSTAPDAATVDSWTTVDFGVGYEFSRAVPWFGNSRLSANVTNAFDTMPPFVDQVGGYDGKNASLLGRFASVQLTKDWGR